MTPLKAIRKHCLECCNNQPSEVALCPAEGCPLSPLRSGQNVKGVSPLKSIRQKCFDCGEGTSKAVRECEFEECPLFVFRFGHNPSRKGIGNHANSNFKS